MSYILALLAPLFYALSNFLDKYTLDKHFRDFSALTYSASIGIIGLPFLAAFAGIVTTMDLHFNFADIVLALIAGILFSLGITFYAYALQTSDTSLVGGLFQLIVVFNYILGALFLDERLGALAGVSAALVLLSSFIYSIESTEDGTRKVNYRSVMLMLAASLAVSLSDVIFKVSATSNGSSYIVSQFFEYTASVVFGVVVVLLSRRVRNELASIINYGRSMFLLVAVTTNEAVNMLATFMQRRASLDINLTVLQTILGSQPVYLVILGIVLTRIFPKIISENISKRHLIPKLLSLGLMVLGTVGVLIFS